MQETEARGGSSVGPAVRYVCIVFTVFARDRSDDGRGCADRSHPPSCRPSRVNDALSGKALSSHVLGVGRTHMKAKWIAFGEVEDPGPVRSASTGTACKQTTPDGRACSQDTSRPRTTPPVDDTRP